VFSSGRRRGDEPLASRRVAGHIVLDDLQGRIVRGEGGQEGPCSLAVRTARTREELNPRRRGRWSGDQHEDGQEGRRRWPAGTGAVPRSASGDLGWHARRRVSEIMTVDDLMEREVVTLNAGDTLSLADDVMRLGRIRHLPVVEEGLLVGILSQRDLFRAAVSSVLQLAHSSEREWLARIPVRAVMTPTVISVPPGTSIRRAVEIMLEKRIGCLPVAERGRLLGLLSETDCLRHLAHLLRIAEDKADLPEVPPAM